MKATIIPRVKVCCIASSDEARAAIELGASALGLVGAMPSGPGVIADEQIRVIAAGVPPPIATFLLTSRQTVSGIVDHHRNVRTTTVQIVDALREGDYRELRGALPGVKLVQVIHVTGPASVDEALCCADGVDALLLDSGNPTLAVKELGGTGRVHDWSLSRAIREQANVPVFLAGGLRTENVRRAIDEVCPWGLDVCSGVRTDGRLDTHKLERFLRTAGVG